MVLIILVIAITLIVLVKLGVFRKPDVCRCCGNELKGTEQKVFGNQEQFILCKACAKKISPVIKGYARLNWNYEDYLDYLAWDEETKEERSKFKPDYEYGFGIKLSVDTERGLFSFTEGGSDELVFRFADLKDYKLDFKPEKMMTGQSKGDEIAVVEFIRPPVCLEEVIYMGVTITALKKGLYSSKYEFYLREDFKEIIRVFAKCFETEIARRKAQAEYQNIGNIDEIEKALALFMFDNMDEVTEDSLKKQRNALIKAFHPDNNVSNEMYSQKINAAYELLYNKITSYNAG